MRIAKCLLVAVLAASLSGSALAAPPDKFQLPKVALQGADKPVALGELVELTVSQPDTPTPNLASTSVVWKVFDYKDGGVAEKHVRVYSDGAVVFGTGTVPKKMLLVATVTHLYVVKDGDKVTEVATRTQVLVGQLTIGVPPPEPAPQPTPVPPPAPTPTPKPTLPAGKFGLAQFAYDAAQSVPADVRAKGAKASAAALRGVAKGTLPAKPEDFLKACKAATDKALDAAGVPRSAWDVFGSALSDKMWDLYHTAKKLNTVQDFADAIGEVSDGLETIN